MKVMATPLFGNTPSKPTSKVVIEGLKKPTSVGANSLFASAKVRKRLEVTESDFHKFSQNPAHISAAKNIVIQTNVDELRYDYVLDIGKEHQEAHANLISTIIALSNDPYLSEVKKVMADLIDLLQTSPFEKKWFGKSMDINEMSQKAKIYSDNLQRTIPKLNALIADIDKAKNLIDSVINKIEPYTIAVAFFSEYKKDNFPADLFISRLSSLTSTGQTLVTNKQQLDILRNGVMHYYDAINNIVLTEVPMWVTSCLNSTISKTATQSLDSDRENLIDKIKKQINI